MTTFSVSVWRKTRPEAAKGKGVAEAIGEVDKALKKAPSQMTQSEAKAATVALDKLSSTLDTARSAVENDKKNKDRTKVNDLIKKWRAECETEKKNISEALGYQTKVANVQERFDADYDKVKNDVDTWHTAATRHTQNGTVPPDIDLQRMLTAVRDGGKVCSVTYIKAIPIPEAKAVDSKDIVFPRDMNTTLAKIKDLSDMGIAFSKEGKRQSRAQVANLDDNVAVEKAVKKVMDAYTQTEAAMKVIIRNANAQSTGAKTIADRVKTEIDNGNTDDTLFKRLAQAIKLTKKNLTDIEAAMKHEGDQWRTSQSPTGKLVNTASTTQGYDKNTHGKMMVDRMQANQMLIRRATLPLNEGDRQLELAKKLLNDSTNHRGYASGL